MKKKNRFFLVLLVLVISVLIVSFAGYAAETKVIRHTFLKTPYIDPAVGGDYIAYVAYCNMYDTLVFPNPDGTMKPWLAKSWEISDDGLTYTFELVEGVKFHNGDELTAEDVVFSLERIMAIGEGSGYMFISSVKEANVLEKYKVQITLQNVFGPFMGILPHLYILNKKQVMANIEKDGPYGEYGNYGKAWLVDHDAGSGPYKVKEMKTGEYLLMEKFDDFWAGWENEDAPQYVKETATTDAMTIRSLISRGELEITDQYQLEENLAVLDNISYIDVFALRGGMIQDIFMNTKKPPTDDIHFRKALAYSIDYQQIIDAIYPGGQMATVVTTATPGYNPDAPPVTMDLETAKREIQLSKYYGKLDQYPFRLEYNIENQLKSKVAPIIQACAAQIGIKVDLVGVPTPILIENVSKVESSPNGCIMATIAHYPEAGSLLESRFHSKSCGTWEQGEWLQDPEIDKMIEDALSTFDKEERFKKYGVIQEIIRELYPTLVLCEYLGKQAYRSDYVVVPYVEDAKQGKPCNPVMGYNFYYRDYKVYPEKAQGPYVPFKP